MLKTQSRGRRGGTNVLEEIKVLAADLTEKIVGNLRDNIQDQMQEDTIVEYASCFDLTLHVSKGDRIELVRKPKYMGRSTLMVLLMMVHILLSTMLHSLLHGVSQSNTTQNRMHRI